MNKQINNKTSVSELFSFPLTVLARSLSQIGKYLSDNYFLIPSSIENNFIYSSFLLRLGYIKNMVFRSG